MRSFLMIGAAALALSTAMTPAQAQFWNWSSKLDDCYDEAESEEDALVVQCLHNNIKDPDGDSDDNFQLIKQKAYLTWKGQDSDRVEDVESRIIQLGYNEVDDDDENDGNTQKIFQYSSVTEDSYDDNGEVFQNTVTFQGAVNEVQDGNDNTQIASQSATVNITYD